MKSQQSNRLRNRGLFKKKKCHLIVISQLLANLCFQSQVIKKQKKRQLIYQHTVL